MQSIVGVVDRRVQIFVAWLVVRGISLFGPRLSLGDGRLQQRRESAWPYIVTREYAMPNGPAALQSLPRMKLQRLRAVHHS